MVEQPSFIAYSEAPILLSQTVSTVLQSDRIGPHVEISIMFEWCYKMQHC